jgi:hypothetical protein
VELVETGIGAEKRKQQQFFAPAEGFRNEQDHGSGQPLGR